MNRFLSILLILGSCVLYPCSVIGQVIESVQKWGVLPDNSPSENRRNLQKAIDAASARGNILYVEPVEKGYPMEGGIILRKNVSLIGAHGPLGRCSISKKENAPVGSLFLITDREHPFITVESSTKVEGIQFFYPEQSFEEADKIIKYLPTIQMKQSGKVESVTLSNLSFYGEYEAMNFKSPEGACCEQILFEHCYGYPLSGHFISIDRCWDIPRILHCHVNPANMRAIGRNFSKKIIDAVVGKWTYSYWIDHTDNAVMMDVFTFGVFGGAYLGKYTYGQLTGFNFDCVCVGIMHEGINNFNRSWEIAQGSIIANAGSDLQIIHPFILRGKGHTSISSVEAFSGNNPVLTNSGQSMDYMYIEPDGQLTVSIVGCRMSNYASDDPIVVSGTGCSLRAVACFDKNGKLYER